MDKNMNILLLRPFYGITVHGDMHGDFGISDHLPHVYPDLSFIYSATMLHQAPWINEHIIEANLDRRMPAEIAAEFWDHYDCIIIKIAGPTIRCDLDFTVQLRKLYPDTKIVLAGHVAAFLEKWISENVPEVDLVSLEPLEDYVYKMVNGNSVYTIDDLPSPDYSLVKYDGFRDMDGILRGSLSTSRGCSVGCAYCPYPDFYGRKIEFRSLENVYKDIELLIELGVEEIFFRDQYFTIDSKRVRAFCSTILARGWKFRWRCETRLESLKPEDIDLMVESGMDMICFGVESSTEIDLKKYHRPPVDEKKLTNLVSLLHSRNILTLAFYIIGFPNDHWNRVLQTYQLALRIGSKIAKFSIFSPCTHSVIEGRNVSPDLFTPFDNTMTINPCRHLNRQELLFLVDEINNMYHMEICKNESPDNNYIKGVYDYHIQHQRRFRALVEELQKKLKDGSVLNLVVKRKKGRIVHAY